jgi:hypothetical protein
MKLIIAGLAALLATLAYILLADPAQCSYCPSNACMHSGQCGMCICITPGQGRLGSCIDARKR